MPGRPITPPARPGLIGLSKTVAKELAGKDITCNVVAPGFITTDMTDVLNDKIKEAVKAVHPAASGLASRRRSPRWSRSWPVRMPRYITGQVICVDGGMVM